MDRDPVSQSDTLRDARRQLYARGQVSRQRSTTTLTDKTIDVSRQWKLSQPKPKQVSAPQTPVAQVRTQKPATTHTNTAPIPAAQPAIPETVPSRPQRRTRKRFRRIVLLGSLCIFLLGVGLSGVYMYLGGNEISGDQLTLSLDGPFSAGGGEPVTLRFTVGNENAVPIENATLVVLYPPGTQSVGATPRSLTVERIPLNALVPGEISSIPLDVAFFNEEQSSQTVEATLEYTIEGSNSTFYRDLDPLTIALSSAPLLIRVDSVDKVAAGQTVNIMMTLVSNASTPLQDVLVSLDYPNGFQYQTAEPLPVFNDNVWRVDEIAPNQEVPIVLQGRIDGFADESLQINIDAGTAAATNEFLVDTALAETSIDFFIERPFVTVTPFISGETASPVLLRQEEAANVSIALTNTLPESVYDVRVEVTPSGNVLSTNSISSGSGFYDSNTGTVRWEVANNSSFQTVRPGESRTISFGVNPTTVTAAGQFDITANVYARRVAEPNAAEQLIGTANINAKYSSIPFVGSQVGRAVTASGPLPPEVGQTTTYTLTLVAEAGMNGLSDAIVETTLPVYMSFVGTDDSTIIHNPVSQQIRWNVGDLAANERRNTTFQVSITPSTSQQGRTPVLMNRQTLSGTDVFTRERLQAVADPVDAELSTELGFPEENGIVQ